MHKTRNDLSAKVRGRMADLLNLRLAGAIDLYLQTKQAHWNVKGPTFIALHELFDKLGEELEDYIDDIAERVVAGATPFTPAFNVSPNNSLGDGVDVNDRPFLPYFPYVAPPHSPFTHSHHPVQAGVVPAASLGDARDGGRKGGVALRMSGANPAPTSKLEFRVDAASRVRLQIFDVHGRLVRTLVDQDAAAGTFAATWDGRAEDGVRAARGVYYARLSAGAQSAERRIVLE